MRVNNIYMGDINGVSVGDVFYRTNHLDNKVSDLATRLQNVEDNLAYKDFFETYFNDKYNPHLNSESELASENNVCGMLERMADYLINSEESRQMSKEQETAYVFVDEYLQKKIKREHEETRDYHRDDSGSSEMINLLDSDNVQVVKRPTKRNFVKTSSIEITKDDLNREDEMGDILRDYNLLLKKIDYDTMHSSGKKRKLSLQKFLVKGDMIAVKKSYLGILPVIKQTPSPVFNQGYEYFDFTDFKTVRSFLSVKGDFYESHNLWLTRIDFDNLLEKADLTDEERLVAKALLEGWRPVDIQEDFGIDAVRVRRIVMKNITKKIISLGEYYDSDDFILNERIESLKQYREDNLKDITKREIKNEL